MAIRAKDYFEKLPEERRRIIEERARELIQDTSGTGRESTAVPSDGDETRREAERRRDEHGGGWVGPQSVRSSVPSKRLAAFLRASVGLGGFSSMLRNRSRSRSVSGVLDSSSKRGFSPGSGRFGSADGV